MINLKDSVPMKALRDISHKYPDVFTFLDDIRMKKEYANDWNHSLVYTPVSGTMEYIAHKCRLKGITDYMTNQSLYADVVRIPALAAWRIAKTIYDFDPDLSTELFLQAKADKMEIGVDALRLPYWSIYIRSNLFQKARNVEIDGFFAHFDDWQGKKELRLVLMRKNGMSAGMLYLMLGNENESISDCIERTAEDFDQCAVVPDDVKTLFNGDTMKASLTQIKERLAEWISLILYLSASNAEVERNTKQPFKRTKKVQDIPREVELLDVGREVGIRIRTMRQAVNRSGETREGGSHRSPSMHIRRAHWHTYYTGSRKVEKSKRKTIVHWLEPIIVNQDGEEMPLTIVNVKK